jgi:hypothetical protein
MELTLNRRSFVHYSNAFISLSSFSAEEDQRRLHGIELDMPWQLPQTKRIEDS